MFRIDDLIREQRERLVFEWQAAVEIGATTKGPILLDDMPRILLFIRERMDRSDAGLPPRLRLGKCLQLRQVLTEYSILRATILRHYFDECGRKGQAVDDLGGIVQLDGAIDAAIEDAARWCAEAQHQALRDRDQRFRRVLETLPVAVFVSDAQGTIQFSNEAARRVWGGELRVAPENYDQFKAWFPDGRRLRSEDWGLSRALRTGEVIVDEELNIEGFDGAHKVVRNAAAPIVDGGRLIGGVAVNEDITLLKRSEETRDQFIAILGHDLRSPLNAIALAAAIMLKQGELTGPQLRTVERIQSSAARIRQLIEDLLDFTRARFGMRLPLKPAAADMGEICAHIVDEVQTVHPDRAILLERHGDLRGVWEAGRVAQVISNLVGNAVQHGRDPIDVDARSIGDVVIVAVSNHGPPIPEERRASLFQPFRKGAESKGLGLGLFIAREIVQSHGGTIEVASVSDATTFTTRWPRVARTA